MKTMIKNAPALAGLMTILLVTLALMVPSAAAQNYIAQTVTGSLTAAGSITMPVDSQTGSVAWQITGTFAGTVTFEGTVDGTNWISISAVPPGTAGVRVLTATAPGIWQCNVAGLRSARARVSTYTSGTIAITGKRSMATVPFGVAA